MYERGKIRNRGFAQQIKDFSGLKWGRITPTDIDAFVDFGDKVFIFIEIKYGDTKLPTGQILGLQRLCDACQTAGKSSWVLIARHKEDSDIDISKLLVDEYRHLGEWHKPQQETNVKVAIDKIRSMAG